MWYAWAQAYMPNLGGTNINGEGYYSFGAQHSVHTIIAFLDSGSQVQFRSEDIPRKLMHGGWIALGYVAGGAAGLNPGMVGWHKYLEFEREAMRVTPEIVADGFFYKLPAMVGWYVDVYWTW